MIPAIQNGIVQNNTVKNRPAFGSNELQIESKILKDTLVTELTKNDELKFLRYLRVTAKKWKFANTDSQRGQDFYNFTHKNGYTFRLQPSRDQGEFLPHFNIETPQESLTVSSHTSRGDSEEQQNLFDEAVKAFMAFLPKK